jgi:hypothetical protein
MKIPVFFLLACFPTVLWADRQPHTLEAAETLEREKKYDQAMAVYEEWLKEHTSDRRFAGVLRRCGELKKNPLTAIELYKRYLPHIRDTSRARGIHRQIAFLYEMLGDYRSAIFHFEKVFADLKTVAPDDPWLITLPFFYIACGGIDKAYAWVKRIDPIVVDKDMRAELNYALLEIYLARGDTLSVERALGVLQSTFSDTVAHSKALLRMCSYYISLQDRRKAGVFLARLRQSYPASVEYRAASRLLSGKKADGPALLPHPHEIVGGMEFKSADVKRDETASPAKEEKTVAASGKKGNGIRVQVGSYAMRENADYMVRDLKKWGFPTETIRTVIKGKTYYRVFVGDGLSADEAQIILARLNDNGIGGYLFTEE